MKGSFGQEECTSRTRAQFGTPADKTGCPHFLHDNWTLRKWKGRNRRAALVVGRAGSRDMGCASGVETMSAHSSRILFATGLVTAALASGAMSQQDQRLGTV